MIQWQIKEDFRKLFVQDSRDIAAVDGMRAILMISIISIHCLYLLRLIRPKAEFIDFFEAAPFDIFWILRLEKMVDVFFFLSAFLLSLTFILKHQRQAEINFKSFYVKRFFRIYPLYFVSLLLYGAASGSLDWLSIVCNLLFFENNVSAAIKIIPVGWSLSIEAQFYAVLPLLFIFFKGTRLVPALITLILLSCVVRAAILWLNPDFWRISPSAYFFSDVSSSAFRDGLYYPTWARFGPLMLGILGAWCFVYRRAWIERHAQVLAIGGLGLIVLTLSYPTLGANLTMSSGQEAVYIVFLIFERLIFALGCGLLCISCATDGALARLSFLRRILTHAFWSSWSKLVYPLYLFHFPLVALAAIIWYGTVNPADITQIVFADLWCIFLIATLLSWLVACFMHVMIEMPFHRHAKRLK